MQEGGSLWVCLCLCRSKHQENVKLKTPNEILSAAVKPKPLFFKTLRLIYLKTPANSLKFKKQFVESLQSDWLMSRSMGTFLRACVCA